jgi:hypothetical protein
MPNRNLFFSYHHHADHGHLQSLRKMLAGRKIADYGFKDLDLGESSKRAISRHIQHRLWSSSITVVLVGEQTGSSAWIDWEIWYSLQSYQDPKVARRRFRPKGLLALYLPTSTHQLPERLQANLDSGYAIPLRWATIESSFDDQIEKAYANRQNTHLIQNELPLKDDPRALFGGLSLKKLFGR